MPSYGHTDSKPIVARGMEVCWASLKPQYQNGLMESTKNEEILKFIFQLSVSHLLVAQFAAFCKK